MQATSQTETQSVWDHGVSVQQYALNLIEILHGREASLQWRLPDWFFQYRNQLIDKLLSIEIIKQYTLFHDCGKPDCLVIDEFGKRHFPNHARVSAEVWTTISNNQIVKELIAQDLDIHKLKAVNMNEFTKRPHAVTLLLVGLAEIHSNAQMFGGIDSDSFKIKWKRLKSNGQAICLKLFG